MKRRSAIARHHKTISAIIVIALLATACGATTTTPSNAAMGNGSAGTIGEGAAAAETPPNADRPDDARTPTPAPAAGDATAEPAAPSTADQSDADTEEAGGDAPPETDPTVMPPKTIPPVLAPTPPDDGPTPPSTVPPVFVPPVTLPPLPPVTVPPVLLPNPVSVPTITLPPILLPPLLPASPCGLIGDLPAEASIVSEIAVDLDGDGDLDQALSFLDGGWGIRTVVDGVVSQLDVGGVGPHAVELLGGADVASITAGDEIIATAGGGPSTVNIGVIGVDDDGCAFRFDGVGASPLAIPVGASLNFGNGLECGVGSLREFGFDRQVDGTFSAWSSGLHETSLGVFGYLPASDDFSDGLTADELPAATLECNGFGL